MHAVVTALEHVGVPVVPVSLAASASLPASLFVLPPLSAGGGGAVAVAVAVGVVDVSLPASGVAPPLLSSPHPAATAAPTRLSALNNPAR
jgi:hypothetical protein